MFHCRYGCGVSCVQRGFSAASVCFARHFDDLFLLDGGQDHLVQERHLPADGWTYSQKQQGNANAQVQKKGQDGNLF